MTTTEPYVDLYLLPVPRANLDAYRDQALGFGSVVKEHGALSYRELLADDPRENLPVEDGVVMTAAVVEFASRTHRDEVMDRVLSDPRVDQLMEGEALADMGRMTYGGFAPLVTA
jgi:uncharacterized protein YbaA (DUF1428 family)